MKAFIDTSVLLKKYVEEAGSDKFEAVLKEITQIIVAPTCWLEITSALQRRLKDKSITAGQRMRILKEARIDFNFYYTVVWNQNLMDQGVLLIEKYHLRTLDSIQLASGCLAAADCFLTSDQKLYAIAGKELAAVKLIK